MVEDGSVIRIPTMLDYQFIFKFKDKTKIIIHTHPNKKLTKEKIKELEEKELIKLKIIPLEDKNTIYSTSKQEDITLIKKHQQFLDNHFNGNPSARDIITDARYASNKDLFGEYQNAVITQDALYLYNVEKEGLTCLKETNLPFSKEVNLRYENDFKGEDSGYFVKNNNYFIRQLDEENLKIYSQLVEQNKIN